MGYPTPLTHPAPHCTPRGGITHPIHDPKLATFFAMHKAGRKMKGGWKPPMPPIPTMRTRREPAIPFGKQMALPAAPKAPAHPQKRHHAPQLTEDNENVSVDTCHPAPKRRQMLVQLGSGKMVVAEYWDI